MDSAKKVVLCGVNGYSDVERLRSYIQKEYPAVDFQFLGDLSLPEEELIERAYGAEVILSQYQTMSDKIYRSLPDLKAFCAMGAGYNAASISAATRYGVMVTNVPDYCTEEVANHTVTLILMCHRKMDTVLPWIKSLHWGYKPLPPLKRLSQCVAGFYGFGRIAQQAAEKLAAFGVEILACSPHLERNQTTFPFVTAVTLEELVVRSDFISLHAPLVPENTYIFNKSIFDRMKSSAYLINTARGALVDAADLLQALTEGKIAGAALDVLEQEPNGNELERRIVQLPNVLATGHTAFYSDEALEELTRSVAQEAGRILRGESPMHCVNQRELCANKANI